MSHAQDSRINSSSSVRIARAGAMFVVLLLMGYAVSTQVGSAMDESKDRVAFAQVAQQGLAPAEYFPAQYVNQAKDVEEPIPTF